MFSCAIFRAVPQLTRLEVAMSRRAKRAEKNESLPGRFPQRCLLVPISQQKLSKASTNMTANSMWSLVHITSTALCYGSWVNAEEKWWTKCADVAWFVSVLWNIGMKGLAVYQWRSDLKYQSCGEVLVVMCELMAIWIVKSSALSSHV